MDKETTDIERDVNMAIAKEPKERIHPGTPNNHNRKISKAIKEVTSSTFKTT